MVVPLMQMPPWDEKKSRYYAYAIELIEQARYAPEGPLNVPGAHEAGTPCVFGHEGLQRLIGEALYKFDIGHQKAQEPEWALHAACRKPWKFHHETTDINTGVCIVRCPMTTEREYVQLNDPERCRDCNHLKGNHNVFSGMVITPCNWRGCGCPSFIQQTTPSILLDHPLCTECWHLEEMHVTGYGCKICSQVKAKDKNYKVCERKQ